MDYPSSFAIAIFGVITLATIANIQAVTLKPLGMKGGGIARSQIQATGFTAMDPKLDKLRLDCCTTNTGTDTGLCMASTGTFPKTITITLGKPLVKVGQIKIQAPSDHNVGYVKSVEIWYKETDTAALKKYGSAWPAITNPGISKKWANIDWSEKPKVHTLEIRINSAADFEKKPCLRLELYGCSSLECPVMDEDPKLDAIEDVDNAVTFQCKIKPRNGLRYTTTWYLNKVKQAMGTPPDPPDLQIISVLPQFQLYSLLRGTSLTQGLKCSVTVCNPADCDETMSDPRVSNILSDTATISDSELKLTEGGEGQDVTIKLNGPPVLFFEKDNLYGYDTEFVRIEAEFELQNKVQSTTCPRHAIVLVVKNNEKRCGPDVTDWNQNHILKMKVTIDGLYFAKSIVRKAYIYIKHYDSTNNFVFERRIGTITVTKRNNDGYGQLLDDSNRLKPTVQGSVCYCLNDPHCRTSDGVRYEAQQQGEFILYRNTERNYQVRVNAYFSKCDNEVAMWNYGVTCTCGVAIKADDEVVVFTSCPTTKTAFESGQATLKQYTFFNGYLFLHQDPSSLNGKLPSGMQIYKNVDGKIYIVRFPTGTYVKVYAESYYNAETSLLNVVVVPSLSDKTKSDGACGYYDEDTKNDLTIPGGGTLQTSERHSFMKHWEAKIVEPGSCSLFYGADKIQPANKQSFCTCGQGSKVLDCGVNKDMDPCTPSGMKDVTKQFIDNFSNKPKESCIKKRKKRSIDAAYQTFNRGKRAVASNPANEDDEIYQSFIFNASFVATNPTWPTDSGWTEAKAKAYCENYLLNNKAVINCKLLLGSNFQTRIENCIFDIKVTDGTTFAKATLNNIKAECLAVVEQYPSTQTTLPGGVTRSILLNSLCDDDCNKNGVCKEGVCACNAGYYGGACSLTKDKPPVISYIARDGLCNMRVKNCTRSQIFGMGHIDSSDLKCRITPYNYETGVRDDKGAFTTSATYINFNMLICPHDNKNGTFLIAVSNNNGKDYSKDELMFLPYDSVCQKCTIDQENKKGSCSQLDTGCTIGKACYKHGDVDPKNVCNWCDPTKNINYWSPNISLSKCVAIIAGVTSGVLVLAIIVITVVVYKCCRRKKSVGPSVENIQEEARKDATSAEGSKTDK